MTQQPGFSQYGDPRYGDPRYGDPRYGQPPAAAPDDRTPAALAHASSLIAMALSAGWLSFVGPLVMWLIYRDRSPFVRQAAAGSFNFNLGLWLMSIVGWICIITVIGIPLGLILLAVSFLAQIIGHVIGTLRALKGRTINYPFQLKVLR
ncbi:DUF4870 domain-containing protein [Dietzia cinnamea]|uniref:DUF4870 domain-containing protein n=1 Tax=Dietzia cinnamea TaxID=321318 RepID=UPI000D619D46|nr:DUF4870 domain-containing protein [Dietzia cinnamea]MBM7230838.1 DUF4870 domain-containing protein [Dietzia cinnamea]MCT2265299.1 DUF4870 domain-containing protein [Dietzia cinnamea]PWD95946.1 DUF4870 domain-containing protein [Dietzia maris]